MIKVVDLKGKFFSIEDELLLSIQASIIGCKDDFGKVPHSIEEKVKLLDSDGFEIDSIYLTFKPIQLNKIVFATETFILDDLSQKNELASINLLKKTVDISKNKDKTNFENFANECKNSDWIPEIKAKIKFDDEKTTVSIKASICPQPNDDFYNRQEFYEKVKLLDEDGFELASIPLNFRNTKAKQISSETVKEDFYDPSLSKKIKYIQLMDSISCINPSQTRSSELPIQNKISSVDEASKSYPKGNVRAKSSCKECNSEIPLGVDICDSCRIEKLKKIHGVTSPKQSDTSKKHISYCEKCRCEIPLGAKICDSCRSEQLKKIHTGGSENSQINSIVRTTTPKTSKTPRSEWKPWPPQVPETIIQTEATPEKMGVTGWVIILMVGLFLLNACFG